MINRSSVSNRCRYSNEEMEDIIETVKYFEESGLLNKDISKT